MEDILASIRRILNEDDAAAPAPAASEAGAPALVETPASNTRAVLAPAAAPDDEEVLDLDQSMIVADAPQSASVPLPEPPPPLPDFAATAQKSTDGPRPSELLAPESEAAAVSAVGSLLRTLSAERATQVHRGGPTIEDLVREEIRPLLKAWLDNHLPPLVERLVRSEIERVTGRATH